jgi:Flp pilus assembly pilin Flp
MIETIKTIKFWAKVAVADRKGATALEYALIAAAVAAATMGGFTLFIGRINTFLQNLKFGS